MVKLAQALLFVALILSCNRVLLNESIEEFAKVRDSLKLGQSKAFALALTSPTQEDLPAKYTMPPETFRNENGETVEIYFMRSRRQPDGLVTYDEFTPLVFTSGVLTSIGWAALGGPPNSGQARDVNVQQVIVR